ncbi:hypothetical protein C8R45DRAFT_333961 [Mycena sanguinolenta]|nr:hypothetical protein C8R45DRAFT_333961 [Mycena sanguinolenta]
MKQVVSHGLGTATSSLSPPRTDAFGDRGSFTRFQAVPHYLIGLICVLSTVNRKSIKVGEVLAVLQDIAMATTSFDDSLFIPGPSFHVELPPIDARHMFHFSRRLLFFRCSSDAQRDAQLAAFKTGIHGLLVRCPILGGVVTTLPPDEATAGKEDWRTIVPGRGIELVAKDLRGKGLVSLALLAGKYEDLLYGWGNGSTLSPQCS